MEQNRENNVNTRKEKRKSQGFAKGNKPIRAAKQKAYPYYNQYVVSIDIGSKKTKVVVGKMYKNAVHVEKAFMVNTPEGSVKDGIINHDKLLGRLIQDAIISTRIKEKEAIVTNNSTAIINRDVEIPKVEESEVNTFVKYEIQQYLPINMDEYETQCKVLESIMVEGQEKLRVLAIVYPKKVAKQYFDLLQDVRLKPVVLDVNFNSINKLLGYGVKINNWIDYNVNGSNVVIDMGAENIVVNMYVKGELDFTRIIKYGGNNIDEAISEYFGIKVTEAERKKITHTDLVGIMTNDENRVLNEVVKKELNIMIEEISKIIQFYKNKKAGNTVDKIYLVGGSSKLKGLEAYMSEVMNIQVVKINSTSKVVPGKGIYTQDLDFYFNAIGAILRQ